MEPGEERVWKEQVLKVQHSAELVPIAEAKMRSQPALLLCGLLE